jgi:hypothetical protein
MNTPLWTRNSKGFVGFAACVALVLVGLSGCSTPSPVGGQLSGKVTYPTPENAVGGGTIKLIPVAGGTPLVGNIAPAGTYAFTSVPPGEYKVTIVGFDPSKGGDPRMSLPGGMTPELLRQREEAEKRGETLPPLPAMPTFVKLPLKYGDDKQTPLAVTVKAGKNDPQDFNLTD